MRWMFGWIAALLAGLVVATGVASQTYVPPAGTEVPSEFMAVGTDRPGGDFLGFDLPSGETDNPRRCALACVENQRCRSYTFVRPGVQGPAARCYLKSSAPAAEPNDCCVSGARTGAELVATPAVANPFSNEGTRRRVGFNRYPAQGVIPVAVVIIDWGGGFPADMTAGEFTPDYFADLMFGPARAGDRRELGRLQPLTLPNGVPIPALRPSAHSVASFYWEASNHQLLVVPAGPVIGPVSRTMNPNDGLWPWKKAVEIVAETYGARLRDFDKNGDGEIHANELTVMLFDNGSTGGAAARYPGCVEVPGAGVRLCGKSGAHGFRSRVQNPVHEFMHLLGVGYDTYGWNWADGGGDCWGLHATVMSCTAGDGNDANRFETVDFDAYHRMVYGWASPQLVRFGQNRVVKLTAAQSLEDRPLILHTADWSEIYVVEYRDGTLGGHDAGFFKAVPGFSPPKGLMFWYVQTGVDGLVERPSGIGWGNNGRRETIPAGDDVFRDTDPCPLPLPQRCNDGSQADGLLDRIRPGPNATLDSVAGGDDGIGYTAMIMPSRNPRAVWTSSGTDPAVPVGTADIRLHDWAGAEFPVRLEVQPHPFERDAVLVFITPAP